MVRLTENPSPLTPQTPQQNSTNSTPSVDATAPAVSSAPTPSDQTIAHRYLYALDWRPVGGSPIANTVAVRPKKVSPDDIKPYRKNRLSRLSRPDLFYGADVLGRADGIFVVRIEVDEDFPPEDEDEARFAVCMAAKAALGHRHDVHKEKESWRGKLDPAEVLITQPIALKNDQWHEPFRNGQFHDRDLHVAVGIPDKMPTEADPNEAHRNALICLRRRYLRVFEDLQTTIQEDREDQVRWQREPYRFWFPIFGLIAASGLYLAFLGLRFEWPDSVSEWARFLASVVALSFSAGMFLFESFQMYRWDLRRIRLLRLSEVFYHYANPVNDVVRRIMQGQPGFGEHVTDFSSLSNMLATKTAGEVHRMQLRQLWMTLTLAFISLYFAAAGIRTATVDAAKPIVGEFNGFDCGGPPSRVVGPFRRGEWERLEEGARTPADILAELNAGPQSAQFRTIILLGSSDGESVRASSPIESNSELARRRAAWVAGQLRGAQDGATINIFTLNDTTPLVRAAFEPEPRSSGREVLVCLSL